MSIQRIFALAVCLISILGFFGSVSLNMFRGTSLGPGFMPLVYSIILFIFSIIFFFSDKAQPKLNRSILFNQYTVRGWIYYLSNFGMLFLIYFIGMIPAMAIFGISTQVILKRQNLRQATLFTVLWVGALYAIFVVILKIPFERGLLFN